MLVIFDTISTVCILCVSLMLFKNVLTWKKNTIILKAKTIRSLQYILQGELFTIYQQKISTLRESNIKLNLYVF